MLGRARLLAALSALALFAAVGAAAPAVLFGLSANCAVVRVDAASGKTTPVGAPLGVPCLSQQLSAVDASLRRMYLMAANDSATTTRVVAADLDSGALVFDVETPLFPDTSIENGLFLAYDVAARQIVCVGPTSAAGALAVYALDAQNRTGRITGTLDPSWVALGNGPNALDPIAQVMYFEVLNSVELDVAAVHYPTGKLVFHDIPKVELLSLAWDAGTKLLRGFSNVDSGGYAVATVSGRVEHATGHIAGMQDFLQPTTAIDPVARTMCALMQPLHVKAAFSLVCVDADTGAVKTQAAMCANSDVCPVSLHFV